VILLGFGTTSAAVAVGVTSIAVFARLARSRVVSVRVTDFVEAAYGSGGTFFGVLWRHILPNSLTPVIALAALQFGSAILQISTLGFSGTAPRRRRPSGACSSRRAQLRRDRVVAHGAPRHRRRARRAGDQPPQSGASRRGCRMSAQPLLSIRDLAVQYRTRRGTVDAVRGVSFDVEAGSVTALVGESGSGKTTVAQTVIGLLASNGRVSGGASDCPSAPTGRPTSSASASAAGGISAAAASR
jgi:ABC-type multidrug transport system fused ATPase/permease subunit